MGGERERETEKEEKSEKGSPPYSRNERRPEVVKE